MPLGKHPRYGHKKGPRLRRCRGESFKVLISEIYRSILLLVREQDVLSTIQSTYPGLNQRVQPKNVLALCGIYVDDYLSVGPHDIVTSFLEHLRVIWKTTHPVYMTPGDEFGFLGITLELTSVGLLLHQRAYTEAFLEEYKDVTLAPAGKEPQTGYVILLSFGMCGTSYIGTQIEKRKIAEPSAEAELYAPVHIFQDS